MQFAVPQFTEVEDRLIARLTLKQFLVLLGVGGIILFFWSIFGPSFIFFIIAVPLAVAGIGAALGRYNGRPMFTYFVPMVSFLSSNRVMIFKREVVDVSVTKSDMQTTEQYLGVKQVILEPTESRLKKLAYLLDSKTLEEGRIISSDHSDSIPMPVKKVAGPIIKKISTVNTLTRTVPAQPEHPFSKTTPIKAPVKKFDPNKVY